MGLEVTKHAFEPSEHEAFSEKLAACLRALEIVLSRPSFGEGPTTIGAELELHLVAPDGRPAPINRLVLDTARDGRLVPEIDRFNLEINAPPIELAGTPFSHLHRELEDAMRVVREAAARHGARPVPIGILPSLDAGDLSSASLTEGHRYVALDRGLRALRGAPFSLHIEREDALDVQADELAQEGANTSFQVHLRTSPRQFTRTYDAAQLAIAPVLAVATNSPLFLGRRLWDETRIALFRHAVEDRARPDADDWRPARVSFGHGWCRMGAFELFAEAVRQHAPVLPVVGDEQPEAVALAGGIPQLAELRLHQGTVWRWNRAIYDASAGGHLRIEMRPLPAGPTVIDMVANAAFALGLTLGLTPSIDTLLLGLNYSHARRNFYEAAKWGMEAKLLWPVPRGISPSMVGARDLALRLLPIAREGLSRGGVDPKEVDVFLGVIEARVRAGITGADWQRRLFGSPRSREEARSLGKALVLRYADLAESGKPVHEWPMSAL